MRGEQFKLDELYVKWGRVEEFDKPIQLKGVPRLKVYLGDLKRLTEDEKTS